MILGVPVHPPAVVDVCVVGGGIVGLAVARQVLLDRPGAGVLLVEKESEVANHQSGRNSGVVHAGLYYRPGSEKARLCRQGVGLLQEYCAAHGLPYDACGKLVVALDADEEGRLEAMQARGGALGVPGLERLGPDGIRAHEPHVVGRQALWSPSTAITDFAAVARALAQEVTTLGGEVRLGTTVTAIDGHAVRTDTGDVDARSVVICAGLQADRLSRAAGGPDGPRIVPFRGEYLRLRPDRSHLVRGLVYPVPDPTTPFLGVHFTRRVDGAVDVGPNAVLALALEGYRWRDVSPGHLASLAAFGGTWRLARRHWRTGVHEVRGSLSRRTFARRAAAYLPGLGTGDLERAPAGVRAQAVQADGTLVDDFVVARHGPVVAIRNAPSPAATSSLAIAEHVASLLPT
ncbi:MAG: L-2-hydroxyglutarate oxidase [Acidimicrobiales bacterium]